MMGSRKNSICPDCNQARCLKCKALRCDCPPKNMEIRTYCMCTNDEIRKFVKSHMFQKFEKRAKWLRENKPETVKHFWEIMKDYEPKWQNINDKPEKPVGRPVVLFVEEAEIDSDVDDNDIESARLSIIFHKEHDEEDSQSDKAANFFLKLLSKYGASSLQLLISEETDTSTIIIETRSPNLENDREEE